MSLPSRLGRYEIIGRLATGGMAEILLGRITGLGGFERPVVIKRILPHLADSSEFSAMFLDEARLVARIRHPNVIGVSELGHEAGELFLVMEYLEGESVAAILQRAVTAKRPLPTTLAVYIIAEAAAGLHAAHELTDTEGFPLDLVHRDISPQNLFVLYSGGVRILDFGIAKVADQSHRTTAGQLKGKFQYMAPEQCLHRPLDRRADLFSLGVVLFEVTTMRRLFKRENEFATFKAICEDAVPDPTALVPGYPPSLGLVVKKALERDPQQRYQTAAELRRDLLVVLREIDSGDEPAASVATYQQELFADRIAEKAEMLRRVGSGSDPTRLPKNEPHSDVDLPRATEMTSALVPRPTLRDEETTVATTSRRRVGRWVAAVLLAISAIATALLWRTTNATRTGPDAATAASVTTTPSSSESPSSSSTFSSKRTSVRFELRSVPDGARVSVDGAVRGTTPLDFDEKASGARIPVRFERPGFVPVVENVTLEPGKIVRLTIPLDPVRRESKPIPTKTKPRADPVPLF